MGAMLPIFLLGFLVGMLVINIYNMYKKETPSDTKLRIQEAQIIQLKSDNQSLKDLTDLLYKQIEDLKKEKK